MGIRRDIDMAQERGVGRYFIEDNSGYELKRYHTRAEMMTDVNRLKLRFRILFHGTFCVEMAANRNTMREYLRNVEQQMGR